jgi:hypothetical protein
VLLADTAEHVGREWLDSQPHGLVQAVDLVLMVDEVREVPDLGEAITDQLR